MLNKLVRILRTLKTDAVPLYFEMNFKVEIKIRIKFPMRDCHNFLHFTPIRLPKI